MIKISKISACAIALLCLCVSPAKAADKLVLLNGDMLSGKVTSYNATTITFETKYGAMQIPVADVWSMDSQDVTKKAAIGSLLSSNRLTTPQIVPQAAPEQVSTPASQDVAKIEPAAGEPEEQKKLTLWGAKLSGSVNFGADLKTGNTESNGLTADANVKARWDKHRGVLELEYNREEDEGDVTEDNRQLTLGHDYFFAEKWFLGSEASFEQDDIELLDLRTTLSTGLGYQAYERDDLNLKFVFGPGYINEEFEDDSSTTSATLNWDLDYDQKFYDDLFRLFHNHDLVAPTDDFGAFIFQSKSGIKMPIRSGIVATGQFDYDWTNEPAEGAREDDATYSLKLGYEW